MSTIGDPVKVEKNKWRVVVVSKGVVVGEVTFIAHGREKATRKAPAVIRKALSRKALASRIAHTQRIVRKQELMSLLA